MFKLSFESITDIISFYKILRSDFIRLSSSNFKDEFSLNLYTQFRELQREALKNSYTFTLKEFNDGDNVWEVYVTFDLTMKNSTESFVSGVVRHTRAAQGNRVDTKDGASLLKQYIGEGNDYSIVQIINKLDLLYSARSLTDV